MRDIWIMLAFLGLLPQALMLPFVAMLLWTWFAIMYPHREAYGFSSSFGFNTIIAGVFFLGWFFSKERKIPPYTPFLLFFLPYLVWIFVSLSQALDPESAWFFFNQIPSKVFIYVTLLLCLINSQQRLNALIAVYCASLGYYAVTIAANVIIKRGANFSHSHFGPSGTIIEDNNILALALVTSIPLIHYLRQHDMRGTLMRRLLDIVFFLAIVAVIGSYSRGGFLSLMVAGSFYWKKSRHKLKILAIMAFVAVLAFMFMPAEWFNRVDIKESAKNDGSVQGRIAIWQTILRIAQDYPWTGGGMRATEQANIMARYWPVLPKEGEVQFTLAAHSIYFQTLCDNGWVGLFFYIGMAVALWFMLSRVRRLTKARPDYLWAHDMALATQASLAAFMVGGAFLSVSYYDGYYILAAIASGLYVLTKPLGSKKYLT